MPLSVESIDEQFIVIGTEDYRLLVDIMGSPDSVDVRGHMEGFSSNWNSSNSQLSIESEEVTRLISGVTWDLDIRKGSEIITPKIKYNVVPAASIFHALPTIHLYRGVDINFDILIDNIPALVIPNARLLGLKSDLLDNGVKVSGVIPLGSIFSSNNGNITIIVPSETDASAETHDYPYQIESGAPQSIGAVSFNPKGNYGEISFDDVTHAINYQWRVGDTEDSEWNNFSNSQPTINIRDIEVTPGNLNATIKFPHVQNASTYQYRLDTSNSEGLWVEFNGTLVNNFITTIIPNLEEGVEYTLNIRVSSPWIGSPVSVSVFGGRVCYTLQINVSDRDNQWLYIFHTGHPNATQATRIKRLLLPVSISHPDNGGLAVNSDGDVFIFNNHIGNGNDKALYVFESDTINSAADGSRLTQDRRHPFPNTIFQHFSILGGLAEYEGNFYARITNESSGWSGHRIIGVPNVDGEALTNDGGTSSSFSAAGYGYSADDENIYIKVSNMGVRRLDRNLFISGNTYSLYNATGSSGQIGTLNGLKVLDRTTYICNSTYNRLELFRVQPDIHSSRDTLYLNLLLPSGLTTPRYLDILT